MGVAGSHHGPFLLGSTSSLGACEQKRVTMMGMAKTPRRYGWALQISGLDARLRGISSPARAGLDYARGLARNARERREHALFDPLLPERLTVAAIAREEGTSAVTIHGLIKQARIELFGKDLGDSAIYTRLRQAATEPRSCAEPECENELPWDSSRAQRYCREHSSGAARVRRHRQLRSENQTPS